MTRLSRPRPWYLLALVLLAGATTLIRSANDEIRWVNRGAGGGGTMFATAVHPTNPNIVLMGSDVGGLYRTADGGKTWSLRNQAIVDPQGPTDYGSPAVAFSPANGNVAFYSGYRSTDAGLTWTKTGPKWGAHALGPHPTDANVVWAGRDGTIFRVTAGGSPLCHRSCLVADDPACNTTNSCDLPAFQAGHPPVALVRSIVVRPSNANEVLVCTDAGLFKSSNALSTGTVTWTNITGTSGLAHGTCSHIGARAGTDSLYLTLRTTIGTPDANGYVDVDSWSGGVYKSTGANWGETWTAVMGSDLNMPEYAANGSFTNTGGPIGIAGWHLVQGGVVPDSDFFRTSPRSMKVPSNGSAESDPIVIQSADRGALYILSIWAHGTNSDLVNLPVDVKVLYYSDTACTQVLNWPGFAFNNVEPVADFNPNTSGWRRYEKLLRFPDAAACYTMRLQNNTTSGNDTWYDDLSLKRTQSLPKRTGPALTAWSMFPDWGNVVVDPTDANKVYVETEINRGDQYKNAHDSFLMSDSHGVWKSSDGGTSWSHITRTNYRDNVLDGLPVCGNGVCEGHGVTTSEGENGTTCPADCPTGCGDKVCGGSENLTNCPVDCLSYSLGPCPGFTVPTRTWYEAHASSGGYQTWGNEYDGGGLAIGGSSSPGTLYLGNDMYKTTNGGCSWEQIATDPIWPVTGKGDASYKARGDSSDIYVYAVGTHPTDSNLVYMGTKDLLLQASRDGGKSFVWEGAPDWWQLGQAAGLGDELGASAVNSIIVDPTVGSISTIYVGAFVNESTAASYSNVGGVFRGDYDSTTSTWTWSIVGTPASHPKGGAIALARNASGTFFAGVYGKGVYRLDSGAWTPPPSPSCSGGTAPPADWKINRLVIDPVTNYLYGGSGNIAAYDPNAVEPAPGAPGVTGVFESRDNGATWCKVSDVTMDKEPVTSLYVYGNGIVLAGTSYGGGAQGGQPACPAPNQTFPSNQWTGDGGLYMGCRWNGSACDNNPNNPWHWTRVLAQPYISGIAVSPFDDQIIYVQSAQTNNAPQGQCAGIFKTLDAGATWTRLPANGLGNLRYGNLFFAAADPHRLYAPSIGSGLFEGTITCGPVAEGFPDTDGDGIADCSDAFFDATLDVTPLTFGSTTGGSLSSIWSASTDDTYQSFQETPSGTPRKLEKVWDFGNLQTGRTYTLNVEAYRSVTGTPDTFDFKYSTKATACANTDGNTTLAVNVASPTDNDTLQTASLGTVNNSHVCVQARDTNRTGSDNQLDAISVDRLFLSLAEALTSNDSSTHPVPDPGSIFSGTHLDTRTSNNTREILKETSVTLPGGGSTSRLVHTWQFFSVPGASSHMLHVEGKRAANSENDNFQFYFSYDGLNYTAITGALISSGIEPGGGLDFSMPGIGGTVYIQVRDTDETAGATILDTVEIDQLTIK